MAGRLIVFEGTDGSGKSTQFARLCRRALEETGNWARERRREHARQAAWSVRAGQVIRILRTIGLY